MNKAPQVILVAPMCRTLRLRSDQALRRSLFIRSFPCMAAGDISVNRSTAVAGLKALTKKEFLVKEFESLGH